MDEADFRPFPRTPACKSEGGCHVLDQRSGDCSEDWKRRSELRARSSLRPAVESSGVERVGGEADQVPLGRVRLNRPDCELVRVAKAARFGNSSCATVLATELRAGNARVRNRRYRWRRQAGSGNAEGGVQKSVGPEVGGRLFRRAGYAARLA